jgi:NAD-dependent SIR2 family protein deacetylase
MKTKNIVFECINCGYKKKYNIKMENNNTFIIRHYPSCPKCGKFEGMKPKEKRND